MEPLTLQINQKKFFFLKIFIISFHISFAKSLENIYNKFCLKLSLKSFYQEAGGLSCIRRNSIPPAQGPPPQECIVSTYFDIGGRQTTPVYILDKLGAGHSIEGN